MPINIAEDDNWKREYLDGLMDQAHARKLEIENERGAIKSKQVGRDADPATMSHFHALTQEAKGLDDSINHVLNANEENVPYTYKEHYRQKYLKQPEMQGPQQPAAPAETDSVWKHPSNLLAHGLLGAKEFTSLPFRAAESLTGTQKEDGGGGYWPEPYSFKKMIEKHRSQLGAADRAKNIDPDATGSQVAEALGGAVIPVGPSLQAGKTLANVIKGAGWSTGAYTGERIARDEPWTVEGLGTSAAAGGALGGVLGKFFGRKQPGAGGVATVGDDLTKAPAATQKVPAKSPMLLEGPPRPGEMRQGKIYGDAPPGGIAGEGRPIGSKPTKPMPSAKMDAGNVPTTQRTLSDVVGIKPQAPAQGPIIEAKGGVVPEVAAPQTITDKAIARTKEMSGKPKLLTPEEAITMAKEMDAAHVMTAKEATLRDVISGKQDVASVPMKRGGKTKGPKSEAPAPAVEGEVGVAVKPSEAIDFMGEGRPKPKGDWFERTLQASKQARGLQPGITSEAPLASAKLSESQILPKVQKAPLEKPSKEPLRKRTEDFIKEQGYAVKEKEPFPGQKSYDLIDPKSGNVVARGDREALTQALGSHPASKGLKLYSFPGDVEEFGKVFKDRLRKIGAKIPDDTNIVNDPHRGGVVNTLLRPFETPEFNVRKSAAGRAITDAGREGDRQISRRVRDLINEEVVPGKEYRTTKLSDYFSGDAEARSRVDKVLVLGDKHEIVYTSEQLSKHGLSPNEINMYQGVREALDKVVGWVKGMGDEYTEFDSRKIAGYIPRVWKGDWEIYVNGNKYLKPGTETSSFQTLSQASQAAHGIKASAKDAKIEIKFFPDPEYLSSQGLNNARVVARLKSNLERMGHVDAKAIDEAFNMGKSVKGFAKHLLERKDAAGYETQDLDRVLNSYFYQAARRVEMQKVKDVAESVLKEHKADLSAGQVRYMQDYVERVAGKPAWDQIVIHNFVQDTAIGKWIDPIRGGKLIETGRELITHLTLGFGNVGWAMINLDGLTRHVWPLLANEAKMVGSKAAFDSEKYMLHGIKTFFNNKGLRQQLAHHGIIDIQHMSESTPKIGHKFGEGKWTPKDISMILGTATEEFSRGVAAIARYQMALDHGASSEQAMQAAARFVEQALGRYSRGGRPPAFTGAIGSTVGLFKTYMSVMLQNGWRAFESKDVGTIARYITGAVGVSGVLGLVPGIEDMDSALTKHTGWSPIESIEKNLHPAVATGLLSLAGVDISRRAGIPELFPNDLKGWSGPVISRFASTIADIANGEYGEALIDMLPNSVRNVLAVARGYKEGKVIGRMDKPSYNVTSGEGALHAVGITPSSEASDSRLYQRNVNKEEYRENQLSHLTRKLASGRASESDQAKFRELGGKSQRIRNEQRRQSETLVERQYKHLPKILRREQPQP